MGTATSSCPRCGYDLSGDIASWNGDGSLVCPVLGRCSECGLDYEWADIFNPFRTKVRGFIEHEERGLYRAAWRTWFLAMRPWRFWRLVKIEFEPRVGRMALWLIILIASTWAIGPLSCNGTQWYLLQTAKVPMGMGPSAFIDPWVTWLVSQQYLGGQYRYALSLSEVPAFVLGPLAASAIAPLVLLCLPHTRRLARVRAVHVVRAAAYGLAWFVPMLVLKSIDQAAQAVTWISWIQTGRIAGRAPRVVDLYNSVYQLVRDHWGWWLVIVMAWLFAWWWFALRTGWRLKDHDKVMRVLAITGVLAAAAAVFLSDDGYRVFM